MRFNSGNKELSELNKEIAELKNGINTNIIAIGNKFYAENASNPPEEYAGFFENIKSVNEQIKTKETRIKFLNGIVVCTNCNSDNSTSTTFCVNCGTRLPHTFINDNANRCVNCGSVIAPGLNFCGTCGTPVAKAAPVAEAPVEAPVTTVEIKEAELAAESNVAADVQDIMDNETEKTVEEASVTETTETVETAENVEEAAPAEEPAPAPVKRFCPQCGKPNSNPEAVFCTECGGKLR